MRIVVGHQGIQDLERDLARIPAEFVRQSARIVKTTGMAGTREAQRIARAKSGPHGRNYFKRITGETTGPMEYEYGPTGDVVGNAVGAGWRNGPPNTDLEQSLDLIAPKMRRDVDKMLDDLFWPGA